MDVQYTGFPTPEIHWYREGIEIQPSRDFQITVLQSKSFLYIPEVFPEDGGTFTVRAVNPYGVADCKAFLVVKGEASQLCKQQGSYSSSPHASSRVLPRV